MKRTIKSLLIAAICGIALTFAMTSCQSELEKAVKEVQKDLPEDVGDGFAITECEIRDGNVEILMSMEETDVTLENELVQQMLLSMTNELKEDFISDKDILPLLKACKKDNTGLRVILKGNQSGASLTFLEFTPQELAADSRI